MANLPVLDLPYFVNAEGGSVYGMTVVGVIEGEVERPSHLGTVPLRSKGDALVIMDIVGVKTKTGSLFYAKGKMLTAVNRGVLQQAKSKGSGRLAVVLAGGSIRSNRQGGDETLIQMFKWERGSFNAWELGGVPVTPLSRDEYPEFFNVVYEAYKSDWTFAYPVALPNGYTEASKNFQYTLVGGQERKPQTSSFPDAKPISDLSSSLFGRHTHGNLGVSTGSNIDTLVRNRAVTNQEKIMKAKFIVENRDAIIPPTKNVKLIREAITSSGEKVGELIENLGSMVKTNEPIAFQSDIEFCAKALKNNWYGRIGNNTGKDIFKNALLSVLSDDEEITPMDIEQSLDILGATLVETWGSVEIPDGQSKLVGWVYLQRGLST